LLPVASLAEASPADRLFGFVAAEKTTAHDDQAYRGAVRVTAVDTSRCTIEELGDNNGVALKVLGGPKSQQFRFYLAQLREPNNKQHLLPVKAESIGYEKNQRVRGRKFYWHHPCGPQTNDPDNTWSHTNRDGQNRSVAEWIAVGSRLAVTIHIEDAEAADLGGLLWVLTAATGENPAHIRFGHGKPLGFGSTRVVSINSQLQSSETLAAKWKSLGAERGEFVDQTALIAGFFHAMGITTDAGESALPAEMREYLQIGRGIEGVDIQYPRVTPTDKGFEWFRNNNSEGNIPQMLKSSIDDPLLDSNHKPRPNNPNNRPKNDGYRGRR
jgi:hypothetical protein